MARFAQNISTCAIYVLIIARYLLGYFVEVSKNDEMTSMASKRIAGGEVTSLEQVPFKVQFFNKGGMCGGTILSKKIVVTAAHCFDLNLDVHEMKIFSSSRFVFDKRSNTHKVWHFILHENYNETVSYENDIAIIIISDEFVYKPTVQKAHLCNTDIWRNENESFLVGGWGEHKFGAGITRQTLMTTHKQYISNAKCIDMTKFRLSDDMFCLYGDGERDTCQGDSGGGVFWHHLLVGITSYGRGCVTFPGVYVNLNHMKHWIDKTVQKLYDEFCTKRPKQYIYLD